MPPSSSWPSLVTGIRHRFNRTVTHDFALLGSEGESVFRIPIKPRFKDQEFNHGDAQKRGR
jgi:hypothetical protein